VLLLGVSAIVVSRGKVITNKYIRSVTESNTCSTPKCAFRYNRDPGGAVEERGDVPVGG
jgi:hypothetical protein